MSLLIAQVNIWLLSLYWSIKLLIISVPPDLSRPSKIASSKCCDKIFTGCIDNTDSFHSAGALKRGVVLCIMTMHKLASEQWNHHGFPFWLVESSCWAMEQCRKRKWKLFSFADGTHFCIQTIFDVIRSIWVIFRGFECAARNLYVTFTFVTVNLTRAVIILSLSCCHLLFLVLGKNLICFDFCDKFIARSFILRANSREAQSKENDKDCPVILCK